MKAAAKFANETAQSLFQYASSGIIALLVLFSFLGFVCAANAQTEPSAATKAAAPAPASHASPEAKNSPRPDLASNPTLYVVGYAHLDTEWRWEYPQVINEFIANTLHDNFKLIEKYPHYIFNFTGSNRYRFMKE